MKKVIKFFLPSKNNIKIFIYMLPAMLIGWWLYPMPTTTYIDFMVMCVLIGIWCDVKDILDKLNK